MKVSYLTEQLPYRILVLPLSPGVLPGQVVNASSNGKNLFLSVTGLRGDFCIKVQQFLLSFFNFADVAVGLHQQHGLKGRLMMHDLVSKPGNVIVLAQSPLYFSCSCLDSLRFWP